MGTDGQLAALLQKLRSMDCWGLESLRTALAEVLQNDAVIEWTLPLPESAR